MWRSRFSGRRRVEPPHHGIAHERFNGLEADITGGSWFIGGEGRYDRDPWLGFLDCCPARKKSYFRLIETAIELGTSLRVTGLRRSALHAVRVGFPSYFPSGEGGYGKGMGVP